MVTIINKSIHKEIIHEESHPLKGTKIKVTKGKYKDQEFEIIDWFDVYSGGYVWFKNPENPDCVEYMSRLLSDKLYIDNEVIYAKKVGASPEVHRVLHVSELPSE